MWRSSVSSMVGVGRRWTVGAGPAASITSPNMTTTATGTSIITACVPSSMSLDAVSSASSSSSSRTGSGRGSVCHYHSSALVAGGGGGRSPGVYHGTTILCVRKNGKVCMIGDGMVSMGNMTIKPNAVKIRRLFPKGQLANVSDTATEEERNQKATLVGFAGATADAFTLLERLEGKLDEYPGQLSRSCVELAKGWRTDKYLRRLEASLIVADESKSLEITGNGDVLEMTDGVVSIGSGSPFAMAAARALMSVDHMSAEEVARKAMDVASDMCVYTNKEFLSYTLNDVGDVVTDEDS